MKAQKFFVGLIAIILVIAIAGGIAIFTIPELQTKIADTIVEKSQIYKDTCTELSVEKARANTLSLQLSTEISAKNELQQRYDDMEAERDVLLAQINEEYVIYFVEYSTNTDNAFKFYLKNFTNESPVITLGMYDVNDVLTETFEFTLVNFANPENAPNTVVEDDLTSLADTYHIKFLDGNMVLSDFICEDGSALDKPFNIYYEVFRKDTMFDVMQSRIARSDTSIIDLQNQLASANARIAQLEQDKSNLQIQINDLINNSGLSQQERQEYEDMIVELEQRIQMLENFNNSTIHVNSNYFLQVLDENNNFVNYVSKNMYDGIVNYYNNFVIYGSDIYRYANVHFGNIHIDNNFEISIPNMQNGFFSSTSYYHYSNDMSVPTEYNVEIVDEFGNNFEFTNANSNLTYYLTIQRLEHTCYSVDELWGTMYENRTDLLKTVDVRIIVSTNDFVY